MTPGTRLEVGTAAYDLALSVQAGDAERVRAATVTPYAGDPNGTAYLVRTTGDHLAGEALAVTQVYLLDATARKAGDSSEAEFSCPLAGTVSETDFGIAGLPPGRFAFATVEARGATPWLLAFLLQQQGSTWKMAGFYPRPRSAAGHDGLWYWNAARADGKRDKPWLAWLRYDAADRLLRPAAFVSSSNLEKLLGEQRAAAPQMLTNGLSTEAPLALEGPGGEVFQVTQLRTQVSDDSKELDLSMQMQAVDTAGKQDPAARNVRAAQALLAAHPELREGFTDIRVVAERAGANPVVVQRSIAELGTVTK